MKNILNELLTPEELQKLKEKTNIDPKTNLGDLTVKMLYDIALIIFPTMHLATVFNCLTELHKRASPEYKIDAAETETPGETFIEYAMPGKEYETRMQRLGRLEMGAFSFVLPETDEPETFSEPWIKPYKSQKNGSKKTD